MLASRSLNRHVSYVFKRWIYEQNAPKDTRKLTADIMNTVLNVTTNAVYCKARQIFFFLPYLPNSCCFLFQPSLLFWDVTKFRGVSRVIEDVYLLPSAEPLRQST